MASRPYIAELHDIGKLADREALQEAGLRMLSHTFHDFDFTQLSIQPPASPSWWGQWSETLESLDVTSPKKVPPKITDDGKTCVILTNIADELSASISRTLAEFSKELKELKEKGRLTAVGLHLLWNPNYYYDALKAGKYWAAFRTSNDLKRMFAFIDQCQSPGEFFETYGENLQLTAEDKSAPWNIIPLGTHLNLTGKIFRVLRYWSKLIQNEGKLRLEYDSKKVGGVTEAAGDRASGNNKGQWVFRLINCYIRFPQALARLQDLNVLRLRREKIKEIVKGQIGEDVERQPYAVLFHTDDFLSLFLPKEPILPLSQVLQPLLAEGFWLEYEELEAELNLLTSTGARTRQQLINKYGDRTKARNKRYLELRHYSLWPDSAEAITPPLCDLCQLRQGELYLKDQVREWLCPTCRKIRDMGEGEGGKLIAQWDEQGKPVVWLKISLDQRLLLESLERLFADYVDNGPGMSQVSPDDRQLLKGSFRPLAAQMEFVRHYQEFLDEFKTRLHDLPLASDALVYPIGGYNELAVIRLDQPETLGLVLDAFYELLQRYFPKCLEDCPIRLSASLSNVKYPYHEHWRFFGEDQKAGVIFHLQQPGIRKLELAAQQFVALREALQERGVSHFLHRLTEIAEKAGELMATVEALNERQKFPWIKTLFTQHGLTFRQIRDFYQLVGVHEERR